MKIRNGFVSNSSSSSYTCDVCHRTESGYDASLSDFGMTECENGHTFCDSHGKKKSSIDADVLRAIMSKGASAGDVAKWANMSKDDLLDEFDEWLADGDGCYSYPKELCPICMMIKVPDETLLKYVIEKSGKSRKDWEAELKAEYPTYDDFCKAFPRQ